MAQSTTYSEKTDRWALALSFLCLIHCLFTPVLLLIFPAFEIFHTHSRFHEITFFALLSLAGVAFYRGYRLHKKSKVLALAGLGFVALTLGLYFEEHTLWITSVGSVFLIAAHLYNMKFCRCHCCED